MIVGGPGSGKSMLARALGERTGLPVYHMDHIHYASGWVERSKAEKTRLTREVHALDEWIFEGGHSTTYPERVARADTLIWLDVPVGRRLVRVLRRTLRYRGTTRPDLPLGCPERLNLRTLEFFSFIWRTRRTSRTTLARIHDEARPRLRVVRLIDDAGVAEFLAGVPARSDDAGGAGWSSEGLRTCGLSAPTRAELDAIYRLGRDAWGEGCTEEVYLDECRRSAKYRRGTWHVLTSNGRIEAALIVYAEGFSLPAGCHGIGSVATAPDARGRGHASRLLGEVLKALERSGSRGVFLFADVETSLYARYGFEPVARAERPDVRWRSFGDSVAAPGSPGYF